MLIAIACLLSIERKQQKPRDSDQRSFCYLNFVLVVGWWLHVHIQVVSTRSILPCISQAFKRKASVKLPAVGGASETMFSGAALARPAGL